MDEDTFRILRDTDWGTVQKTLLAVAINYSRIYPSIGFQTCDDIVQELIVKTLTGQRAWDPKRGELLPWLKHCVRSEINNTANKASTQREIRFSQLEEGDYESEADFIPGEDRFPSEEGSFAPEFALLEKEQQAHHKQAVSNVYTLLEGDAELEDVVLGIDCLLVEHKQEQLPSRDELAEYLGISRSEVDNRLKRLRRRLNKELKR